MLFQVIKACYLSLLYLSGSLLLVYGLYNLYLLGTLMERFHVTSQSSIYALHSWCLELPPTTFTKLLINIAKIARNSLFVQLMQMSSIFDQSVLEPVYMQTLLSVNIMKAWKRNMTQTVKIQKNRQFNILITLFFNGILLFHTNSLHVLLHCNHESSM